MTISPLQTSIIPPFNVNLVLSDGKIQNIMAARRAAPFGGSFAIFDGVDYDL